MAPILIIFGNNFAKQNIISQELGEKNSLNKKFIDNKLIET